ncbi:MAG: hypothetical protein KDA61_04025, partial [Planctomycetales bacterium]|nr:hypothetical protein [Planctomycetales bacterium]
NAGLCPAPGVSNGIAGPDSVAKVMRYRNARMSRRLPIDATSIFSGRSPELLLRKKILTFSDEVQ